jgi:large subunit GTPase 1
MERDSLLEWRRGLAELQENNDLLMTPFERNLEVWRQLWRVIERSDLVVQIVDARNPLLFRSEDLERYVKDVDPRKENLLLVNKADMLTLEQRKAWADYFQEAGISYKFFSASLAKELNEARDLEEISEEEDEEENQQKAEASASKLAEKAKALNMQDTEEKDENESGVEEEGESGEDELQDDGDSFDEDGEDEGTRILTVEELEDLFLLHAPDNLGKFRH